MTVRSACLACWIVGATLGAAALAGDGPEAKSDAAPRPKRVLLVGQGPDGHPWSTHEYMAGMRLLARVLQPVEGVQTIVTKADEPWAEGPELIDGADAVVLFVSEGAKWIHQDPARRAALRRLAERGGGLVVWHWGMGCKDAQYIDGFVRLLGGCHGGPDREYQVVEAKLETAAPDHPILRGIDPLEVHDEFYSRLKFVQPADRLTPLLRAKIDGEVHTVGWAWERPDGGRSFGFSGGHFHRNWQHPAYRRLIAHAVLWSLDLPIPDRGLPVEVPEQDLQLERPAKK